jgi:hypothetical protein
MNSLFAAIPLAVALVLPAYSCEVTKDQYALLKSKMSYADAVKVIGCDGEEVSSSEIAGFKTEIYQWTGASLGANLTAIFQNGRLLSKAQFGLK